MTTLAPYDWLRKIPKELLSLVEPSPFGHAPEWDEAKFTSMLEETFKLEGVRINLKPFELTPADKLKEGFENSEGFSFKISPLKGMATLWVQQGSFGTLLIEFAEKDLHTHIVDNEFKEAFSHFLMAEALFALQHAFPDKTLSLQLVDREEAGEQASQAVWIKDFELSWNKGSILGRLVIPDEMRQSWKEKYKNLSSGKFGLYDKLQLDVHIEAGRTHLSRKELKELQKGDYLILETCHLQSKEGHDPGEKGRILLSINKIPFFRARLKDGSIKILEHPLFYEVGTTMSMPPKDDEFEEEEEEYLEEEEEEEEELEEELPLPETESPPKMSTKPIPQKPLNVEEIPLEIIVEAGRFQMTVQKLSELQPGSIIDLDIHPEQGVDLVINGTCIAKGELLKVGESLGVRILDIAK